MIVTCVHAGCLHLYIGTYGVMSIGLNSRNIIKLPTSGVIFSGPACARANSAIQPAIALHILLLE